MSKTITIQYFAILREHCEKTNESVETNAKTPDELYKELSTRFNISFPLNMMKVVVNDSFVDFNYQLQTNDTIAFIPPVAGG